VCVGGGGGSRRRKRREVKAEEWSVNVWIQ
jgi:hypothetical protein